MNVEQMREAILGVYKGDAWKRKVRRMPDGQVIAIHLKFSVDGKFDQKAPVRGPHHSVYRALEERRDSVGGSFGEGIGDNLVEAAQDEHGCEGKVSMW